MATIDVAKAIGKEDQIGSIEKGKKAVLITIDKEYPHMVRSHHIPSTLVYQSNGSEVTNTIIDGNIVMENRKTPSVRHMFENPIEELAKRSSKK